MAGLIGAPLAACGLHTAGLDWEASTADSASSSGGGLGGAGGAASSSSAAETSTGVFTGASSSAASSGGGGGKGPVATPTFVQAYYAVPQQPQNLVTSTYTNAQTQGNTNILAIGWNDAKAVILSVKDSADNQYIKAIDTYRSPTMSQAIYYAPNIKAAGPATNNVTVVFDQAAEFVDLRITEYSGLAPVNAYDQGTSNKGNGILATTGKVTTNDDKQLLFAAGMTRTHFTMSGLGFSQRLLTMPDGDIVEDNVPLLPTTQQATAPLEAGEWLLQLAVFLPGPAP